VLKAQQKGRLLSDIEVLMSGRRTVERLSVIPISTVLPAVTVLTIILRITLAITMVRATGTVPVTSTLTVIVSVTIPAFVLTRRIIASAATRGRRTSPSWGASSTTTSITITARLKSPRGRGRCASPLNL
jgi:hypothetical protein